MIYYPPRFLFRRYEILRRVRSGHRFVEIGPGNLNLAIDLLAYFEHGVLVDYNPAVQAVYARLPRSSQKRLHLAIADVMTGAIQPASFDCVVACEVMEHVADDETFLRILSRLLRPGGQLILSVPSRMKYWSIHDEIVGHLRRYEKETLQPMLARRGLDQIEFISYGFPFVNLLRLPRLLLARWQYRRRAGWSQIEQTRQSGLIQAGPWVDLPGLVCNPTTIYPLAQMAAWFNQTDWSDGYVITAEKTA